MGEGGGTGSAMGFRGARRMQLVAALAAVGLTVALAQQPVHGAFTGSTQTTASQASTAATFCASPGNATVTAVADSHVDQGSPTSVGGGTDSYIVVTSQTGSARRVYVRFDPLPTVPSRCTVTTATLRLFAESQVPGRTLAPAG